MSAKHPPASGPSASQTTGTGQRVEVTVLKAHNLSNVKVWLRMKRQFYVTVTNQSKTLKSKSVRIDSDGETVKWSEKLGDIFVQQTSPLKLRLYAKRFLFRDILIGAHEMRLPVKSASDIPLVLSKDSTQPVTLHVAVTVSASATSSPIDPIKSIAANVGNPAAEGAIVPSLSQTDAPVLSQTYATGGSSTTGGVHDSANKTEVPKSGAEAGAVQSSDVSGPVNSEPEKTIDEIIETIGRFRILSVGRSGVGKSSLINCVFGIKDALVENYKPGKADIQKEFLSPENRFFVLHDSKGYEPGDPSNFETLHGFIQQRSEPGLPLRERIHGLWLCTETPTAGSRIFEMGDERLLRYADEMKVPLLLVFTRYDRLVKTKEAKLRKDNPQMDPIRLRKLSEEEAEMAFEKTVQSLEGAMNRLKIQMPLYVKVSVRPGYDKDVSSLVKVTRDMVKMQVKGDAWVLWAVAQRSSLPVTINACIEKGISYYARALTESAPGPKQLSLSDCLEKVHHDILTCWNFKGEDLNSPKFGKLMLCLVQNVHTKSDDPVPTPEVISEFINGASEAISPPEFVGWLSTTVLENTSSIQQFLIAYAVDLISVLRELFDITLVESAVTITWVHLKKAFEKYGQSGSRQRVHKSICSDTTQTLTAEDIRRKVRELLDNKQ